MKAVLQADGTIGFEKWGPDEWIDVDPREIDWKVVKSRFPKKPGNRDIWTTGTNILWVGHSAAMNPQFNRPFQLMYPAEFKSENYADEDLLLEDLEGFCKRENAELCDFYRSQLYLAYLLYKGLPFDNFYKEDSLTRYRLVKGGLEVGEKIILLGGASEAKVHPDNDGIGKSYPASNFWVKGHLVDASPLACRFL